MKTTLRTVPGFVLAGFAALAAFPRDAHATPTQVVAPPGGGLPALAVSIDVAAGIVRTRTCAAAAGCSADGSTETIAIRLDRALAGDAEARAEVVAIGEGRHVVHVVVRPRAASARNVAWEAILAAGQRAAVFADATGFARGDEGEHTGTMLQLRDRAGDAGAKYVVKGDIREDLRLCGQPNGTPLAPEMLDPKTLAWRRTGFQRLTVEQRQGARALVATAKGGPADPPLGRLVVALGTSGASSGTALTDGDPRTAWTEEGAGEGRGEFVVMRVPADVPIARIAMVFAPASATPLPASGAAPKSFFLVTDTATLAVSVPEDAWAHPGAAYEIALGAPMKTSCLALVLDEAYARGAAPDVTVAELYAYSEFDAPGATMEAAAKALGDSRAPAAAAVLKRAGDAAIPAVLAVYDKLDREGRSMAVEIALSHPACEVSAPLLVRAVSDRDPELARRARGKIERCGKGTEKALVEALRGGVDARAQIAPLLAKVAPDAAIDPLADVVSEGPKGARAAVRGALGAALKSAEKEKLIALLGDRSRPARTRVDILRAARYRLGDAPAEANAAIAELLQGAPMATRYLLATPIAELARSGDAGGLARVRAMIVADPEWPVRAAAAEAAAQVPAAAEALAQAARDPEPRVREAALRALVGSQVPTLGAIGIERLAKDGWTFVRVGAVVALAGAPRAPEIDAALTASLKDASPRVRAASAAALGSRRASGSSAALRAVVEEREEEIEVRIAATEALGALCDSRSLELLTRLARAASVPMGSEADARVGAAAIDALGKLHPADIAARLAPALDPSAPRGARALAQRAIAAPGACR